ncbi:GntR family transcriptional regulator [Rhizobium sp. ERR 922]|uniref:GntR family transcriptional regulator n=1 Tax=unclassified Rhizobium TaxID=2613769 RepID=UPI00119DFBF1|nr:MULTISPECIES: GntR family transcriptional regulator [unclassified Rhizobium]TWB53119.1 GntR family transcriptional regulator [Rhizobium sp. ERR 922]TWB95916.1 GntR family transcriptional regulator [Rhizobium sp. ERR 942]
MTERVESDMKSHVRRVPGVSFHRQVYMLLKEEINQGVPAAGFSLPSEDELAARFGVARVTIRTALAALETDGLIERRQGKGTFVRATVTVAPLQSSMADLLVHMRDVSSHTEVAVLEFEYVGPPAQLRSERGGENALFQRAVRLRSHAGKPLFQITTFVPEHLGRTYSREELAGTPLLDLLKRAHTGYYSGKQIVSATVADLIVAPRLGLAVGDPLLVVKRRYYDKKGDLVEYLEMLASPSVFELHMSIEPSEL